MHWLTYLALFLAAFLLYKLAYWIYQGRQMHRSGYVAPSPSWLARYFYTSMCRLVARKKVGPLAVEGVERLPSKGRLMFVATHTYELDFAMVAQATGRSCRFMTAASQLKGLQGIFGAWTGAIPVNTEEKGGGDKAVAGSIDAFSHFRNECFLIFPQGKLVEDNVLRREDFRNGFARIAKGTKAKTGDEPLYLVPIAIDYKRDPARAINESVAANPRRAFGKTNYGAAVVIGHAVSVDNLSDDANASTDLMFSFLEKLMERAKALPVKSTAASSSNCCRKDD